tara:strand:+ start:101 stop:670 length:570 start_codon:yes stop_codon:yes gene_type:complete
MEILLKFDEACFHFINWTLSNPIFDFIMPLFHQPKYFIPLLLILWILAIFHDKPNRWKLAFIIPLVIILVDQSGLWIKKIVLRPRPFVTMDPVIIHHLVAPSGINLSFPSNHAANNAALAIVFSAVYYHLRFFFWGFAITVMFSRIYIGVHYPLDVISGCLLGSFYGLILVKGWDYFNNKHRVKTEEHI